MSVQAMTWVLESAPIPDSKEPGTPSRTALTMVLMGMANHADRDGRNAFCSIDTLAAYGRMSRSTAKRCIQTLLEHNLISRGNQDIPRAHLRIPNPPKNYDLNLGMAAPVVIPDDPEIQQGHAEPVANPTGSPEDQLTGSSENPTGSSETFNRFTREPRTVTKPPIEPSSLSPKATNSLADPPEKRFIPVDPPPERLPTAAEIEQARLEQHERNARHMAAIRADLAARKTEPEPDTERLEA